MNLKQIEEDTSFDSITPLVIGRGVFLVYHSRIVPHNYARLIHDYTDAECNRELRWAGFGRTPAEAYIDFLGRVGQI